MPRANTSHPARQNLSPFLDKLRKNVSALVVDEVHLFDTELADFLFAEVLALSATWTSGSTRTAGATFAATTTATRSSFATSASATMSTFPTWSSLTFAGWSSCGSLWLFLFLCHTFLPFPCRSPTAASGTAQSRLKERSLPFLRPTESGCYKPTRRWRAARPLREPERDDADGERHAGRVCAKASFGVSGLHRGARSDT